MQRITSVAELKEGTTYYFSSNDEKTGKEVFKRAIKFLKVSEIKQKATYDLETDKVTTVDYQTLTLQHVVSCKQFKDCTEPGQILEIIRKRKDAEMFLKEKINPFKTDCEITDDMVWDRIKDYMNYSGGCPFEFILDFVDNKTFISKYMITANIYVRNQKSMDKRYFVLALLSIGFEFMAADVLADEFYPRDVYDKSSIPLEIRIGNYRRI
jgi:hypothetical protein